MDLWGIPTRRVDLRNVSLPSTALQACHTPSFYARCTFQTAIVCGPLAAGQDDQEGYEVERGLPPFEPTTVHIHVYKAGGTSVNLALVRRCREAGQRSRMLTSSPRGISTPKYFSLQPPTPLSPRVPATTRFLCTVREPVARFVSAFYELRKWGHLGVPRGWRGSFDGLVQSLGDGVFWNPHLQPQWMFLLEHDARQRLVVPLPAVVEIIAFENIANLTQTHANARSDSGSVVPTVAHIRRICELYRMDIELLQIPSPPCE